MSGQYGYQQPVHFPYYDPAAATSRTPGGWHHPPAPAPTPAPAAPAHHFNRAYQVPAPASAPAPSPNYAPAMMYPAVAYPSPPWYPLSNAPPAANYYNYNNIYPASDGPAKAGGAQGGGGGKKKGGGGNGGGGGGGGDGDGHDGEGHDGERGDGEGGEGKPGGKGGKGVYMTRIVLIVLCQGRVSPSYFH